MRIDRYIMLLAFVFLVGCERKYQDEPLLLEWTDEDEHIVFRVTEKPGAIVHTFTTLWVQTADGHVRREKIDDDAYFARIAFVLNEDWFLVLNDDYVLAGYNYTRRELPHGRQERQEGQG